MSTIAFGKKPVQNATQAGLALERHYSVAENAAMWALSENTVRRMFEEEDGVLHWGTPETRHKRGYRTLRITESVLHRVHRQRELRLGVSSVSATSCDIEFVALIPAKLE